ncbi:MAG TPA: hypothetical protein VF767_03540 [Bryobacteraceae bacterium]
MKWKRRKAFWVSLGVGSAMAAFLLVARRRGMGWRRQAAPHGYRTRIAGDAGQRVTWRFDRRSGSMPPGSTLRIELDSPALVHWTANQWDTVEDTHTTGIAAGVHAADLATEELSAGTRIHFTLYWPEVNRWEGEDFELVVEAAGGGAARTAR